MARLENAAKAFLRINKPLLKMNIIKLSQVSRVAWRVSELRGKGTIIILLQKTTTKHQKQSNQYHRLLRLLVLACVWES